nr:odorant receptor SameORX [Schistocerca americana]
MWTVARAPADVTDRAATRVWMSSLALNARILRVAGLWPDLGSRLSTAYTALAAAFQVSLLVTQGLALVWGRAGLAVVSLNVCVMTTIAAGICKAAAFLWQLDTARQLTACLQGCQHSEEADVAALGVTRYYVGVGGAAVVVWNLMPLLLESDRSLPTIAWYPYDETETPFFELTYVLQGISTFYCCITNVGLNVFLVSLIIYVSDELKNLNDSISSINYSTSHNCNCSYDKQHGLLYRSSKIVADDGERDSDTYKRHSKNLRQRTQFCCVVKARQYLWMCLQYHQELIKTVKKLETTMTGVVFIEFVAGIIVTCLTLFHAAVNAGNMALFLKFIMYLLYMTVGMFIYCWYGQDLMEKSEDLKWAAYSCNWQGAPRSFTDLLKIVMLWAQQPLILSAGKYYRISLKTFVTLLNASYSYYAVLRQINDTEK